MEDYLTKIQKSRDIRESSINLYKSYMNKLNKEFNGDKEFSMGFVKDNIAAITDWIEKNHSNSVARNFYASLLVFLSPKSKNSPIDGYETIYEDIQTRLKKSHQVYIDKRKDNNKTSRENKNWIDFEDIEKKLMKVEKIVKNTQYDDKLTKQEYNNMMEFVILSLYTLLPPRRNEYGDMKIISDMEYQDSSIDDMENNNYLVKGKKNYVFSYGKNAVKSSGDADSQIIDVPQKLTRVLKLWLKHNDTKYLLPKYNEDKPIGKNGLTVMLNKIFSPKKISTSMIRKIYLSHKFGDIQKEQKRIASEMNHSVGVQQQIYVKNDD